ncbi:protein-disulfide isomerase [Hoeflea marina]|uniref:Protein-disulfide isomerase n=1 Tax=Hoeflea marina TaxID=274592 RepID=A0A317PPZ2_9HYPH|nr:DsbA family protein [Hoeflea marina]PWW03523.1 protein-disulfide isomerase [Hoeflea marina]
MTFRSKSVLAAIGLIGLMALPTTASALDDAQKQEFGAFIREYLLANPEIIEEMQTALEARKQDEQAQVAQAAITSNRDAIFHDANDMIIGNPDGDVSIVEFFDYNCGYCKRAMADMTGIVEQDPNVRFVLKEFPILGPDSLAAHRVSMAFRKLMPEKYGEFHLELLGGSVHATEAHAIDIATSLGADEARLREAMKDPSVDASIKQAYTLANDLGISGTPSYVVGDEAVFGAMGADVLLSKIANVRACNSATC